MIARATLGRRRAARRCPWGTRVVDGRRRGPTRPAACGCGDGRGRGGAVRPAPPEPRVRRRAGARPLRARAWRRGPPSGRPGMDASRQPDAAGVPAGGRATGWWWSATTPGASTRSTRGDGRAALGAPPAGRDRLDARPSPGDRVSCRSMDGCPRALRPGGDTASGPSPAPAAPSRARRWWWAAWSTSARGTARLYAVDARTGQARWTFQARRRRSRAAPRWPAAWSWSGDYAGTGPRPGRPAPAPSGGRYSGGERFYGGPGVSGDTIVIGDVGGAVIALDAARRRGAAGATPPAGRTSTPARRSPAARSSSAPTTASSRRSTWRPGRCAGRFDAGRARSPGRPPSWTAWSTRRVLCAPRPAPAAPTASTRPPARCAAAIDDGRYSPAVGAGRHPLPRGNADHAMRIPRPAP